MRRLTARLVSESALPILAAAVGFMLWGGSAAMVKVAQPQFGPIFLVFTRMALALCLVSPLPLTDKFKFQALSAFAISEVTVPTYAALSNLIPVSGVLCGLLILGERLTPLQWPACAVVLGAVAAGRKTDIEKM